jgi:hypothetical protein
MCPTLSRITYLRGNLHRTGLAGCRGGRREHERSSRSRGGRRLVDRWTIGTALAMPTAPDITAQAQGWWVAWVRAAGRGVASYCQRSDAAADPPAAGTLDGSTVRFTCGRQPLAPPGRPSDRNLDAPHTQGAPGSTRTRAGGAAPRNLGRTSMPSQRRTLPTSQSDPEPPGSAGAPGSTATTDPTKPRRGYRACTTCQHAVPASSLLHGECPDCAGLQALPLRGEGGRFLPGLTAPSKTSNRGDAR